MVKTGGIGTGANLKSALQVVAVYSFYEDPPGNQVAIRHKGVEALSCEDTSDGTTCIYERDISGGNKGARVSEYRVNAAPTPPRTLASGTEDIAGSASACWDTFEGGSGNDYNAALADADAAVGYPA